MFLLDTTTVSDYLRGNKNIIDHLRQTSFKLIYISSITKFELEYGLLKKPSLRKLLGGQLDLLYRQINDVGFDSECAKVASDIKQQLVTAGTLIDVEDFYIGAIALHRGFAVVTSNTKHFEKIQGLEVVNWKIGI